jgi:hypothetical protein
MGSPPDGHGITRRGFLAGAAAGLAVGALPAAWLAYRYHPAILHDLGIAPFTGSPREVARPELAMPGRYPGRVVQVRDRAAVSRGHVIDRTAVARMIDRGMAELTGTDPRDVKAAWGTFFTRGDIVGIKVNPVGRKALPKDHGSRLPTAVGSISSPEVLARVIQCLRAAGIPDRDIIVFERYAEEFIDAGYADFLRREFPGVRWYASAWSYTDNQLDITGFDKGRGICSVEAARHVAGYDPDVFTTMGFSMPEPTHSRHDDRRFHSHLSAIVSRMVNKFVNIPVLKDHRSAGVTLALKNMSHGMNNNVARSHLGLTAHGFGPGSSHVVGPNQCNTFIPQAVSQRRLREKATLHLCDGLIGVYEGGPGCWNRSWATWRHCGLLFATDPVALDHVGWDIIDARRAREGWPPVERMGLSQETPAVTVARNLAPLAASGVASAAALAAAARNRQDSRGSESFNLRTPEHVILAGKLGLGTFDRDQIAFREVMQ